MKTRFRWVADPLILGGFAGSLVLGVVNPFYVSLILSGLSVRVIAVGSCLASGLPVLAGCALESRWLFDRLYAVLPLILAAELACTVGAVLVAGASLTAYYLLAMAIFGGLSTTVLYLMQRVKERRYRERAVFERRYAMADALGYLVGSVLVFAGLVVVRRVGVLLGLTVAQTAVVYGCFTAAMSRNHGHRCRKKESAGALADCSRRRAVNPLP